MYIRNISESTVGQTLVPSEITIPLFYWSRSWMTGNGVTSGRTNWISKGSNTDLTLGSPGMPSTNGCILHTLSTKWSPSTKFAFEAAISGNTYPSTITAELWDTSNAIKLATLSTANSSTLGAEYMQVLRSGQFSISPGSNLGITMYANSTTADVWITDASLIVFP